jgi:hypothetical protein
MGVLQEYFAADSDEQAAGVGQFGPAGRQGEQPAFDCVEDTGIDPVVQLTKLVALLTGRDYAELKDDERQGRSLGDPQTFEYGVLTVPDTLRAALAEADDERLREVVVPWSQTEEFWGPVDLDGLLRVTTDLAALARRAQARGQRLYCWWSL